MTRHALSERRLLSDELDRRGPDAPTMCEGWQTKDLAAHLVLRDGRPDLALAGRVPPLSGLLDKAMRETADGDYTALVGRVRSGAPAWSPARLEKVDETINTVEFFVHHEDVRRAQPDWEPRVLSDGLQRALWKSVRGMSRLLFRNSPVGIVLVGEGQGRHAAKSPPEGRGTVIVRGLPAELVLFAYGRMSVARVELDGVDSDVDALRGGDLGVG